MPPNKAVTGAIATPRFTFSPTDLAGLWVVQRKPIADGRGFFSRFYCAQEFGAIGMHQSLVQINHSLSHRSGTVRGLHFQHPPYAETKVVTCMAGCIFDVAVDLRQNSSTFLRWFCIELSAENKNSLVIPPGFAHGYQTLCDNAEILYLVTTPYSAEFEDGLNPFDPSIDIRWPVAASDISPRDAGRAMLNLADYRGLCLNPTEGGDA